MPEECEIIMKFVISQTMCRGHMQVQNFCYVLRFGLTYSACTDCDAKDARDNCLMGGA